MLSTNKNLISLTVIATATAGLFLSVHFSWGAINFLIDLPSFMLFIGFFLFLKLNIYLKPIHLSLFQKVTNNSFKEIVLIGGLISLCLGHFLLAQGIGEPGGRDNLWDGLSASMIPLIYSLILVFLFFNGSDKNINVEPNQNCFEKIPEGKGVNLRFILSYIILILLFISALQIAFLNGAAGEFSDIFGNNLIYLILSLVILLGIIYRTGWIRYFNYLTSLKILFYDKTGVYDIKKVSSVIKTAKSFLLDICILYVILLFPSIATSSFKEFYTITASMSITIFKLGSLYLFLIIHDILILQNAICNDKFYDYKFESNVSRIYILICVYFGLYCFFTLFKMLALLISPEINLFM